MDKFLQTHNLPRLNLEEIEKLTRSIMSKETSHQKPPNIEKSKTGEFYQRFKEESTSTFLKLFQKKKRKRETISKLIL